MQKIKVTVSRQVTEIWEYFVDADALDIPANSDKLTPAEHGNACDVLHNLFNGTQDDALISESLTDSIVQEESIVKWKKIN